MKQFAAHEHVSPVVLFTHIPLARPLDADCGPLRERGTIRQGHGLGYQNTLSNEASQFLLRSLGPSLIFRFVVPPFSCAGPLLNIVTYPVVMITITVNIHTRCLFHPLLGRLQSEKSR